MLEKILTKCLKRVYPERDISVKKVGGKFYFKLNDTINCNVYNLEGKYSYDDVLGLNALTNCFAEFGYTKELGPIAFIGMAKCDWKQKDGYFRYAVNSYGANYSNCECFFKVYSENEAKQIANYTVYGTNGYYDVAKVAPIKELSLIYDSRFEVKESHAPKIFDMDCKLTGYFSYQEIMFLLTGKREQSNVETGELDKIVFATLENGQHVGIMNMWKSDLDVFRGFRDVWEFGKEEPKIQNMKVLSIEEASKIEYFELYVYRYFFAGLDISQIEKLDRTLDSRFNFHFPDGTDYRLIEHDEFFR